MFTDEVKGLCGVDVNLDLMFRMSIVERWVHLA